MNKKTSYTVIPHGNEIIAVGRYAGKNVRAVAKCNAEDKFDYDFGKTLAISRVNHKIAVKRLKNAQKKYAEAEKAFIAARERLADMIEYLDDSTAEVEDSKNILNMLLEQK